MKLLSTLILGLVASIVNGLKTPVATTAALQVRGGGVDMNFPIKPNTMVKVFCGFYALNGALGMPAPESAKDFALAEGTTDYVVFENLGAISLGYAALVYMAAFKNSVPTTKMVAWSSLPLAYVSYKNMLKGITGRMTGSPFRGPINTIFLLGCAYAILTGKGDAEIIAKALAVPPLVIGAVSQLDHGIGRKLAGFGSDDAGETGKAIFVWYAALMAGWGALALMMLRFGLSGMAAIGRAAILETIFMIDCIWIRKWNIDVAPAISNYVFLGIPLLTAASIFFKAVEPAVGEAL